MSEMVQDNNYIKKIPQMPEIAESVFDIIKNGKNLIEELASEISKHEKIEQTILKIANSTYFTFGQEIKTLQQAIVFLGIMRIKNIVLALSVMDTYCPNGYKGFYKHSLMCGLASKILAEQCKAINPDDAFAIGFLHDIGKVSLYDDMLNDIEKNKSSLESDVIENENNSFQTNHCAVGAMILKRWHMPNIIVDCIKHHHTPTLSQLPSICGLIYIADIIASDDNLEEKLGNMPMRLGITSLDTKALKLMARTKAESLMGIMDLI